MEENLSRTELSRDQNDWLQNLELELTSIEMELGEFSAEGLVSLGWTPRDETTQSADAVIITAEAAANTAGAANDSYVRGSIGSA